MGGHRYKSIKIPGGGSMRRRRRRTSTSLALYRRRRRQGGRGFFGDFLKTAGKSVGKALARHTANNLENIVGELGKRTSNKRLKRILNSDLTKTGLRKVSAFAQKKTRKLNESMAQGMSSREIEQFIERRGGEHMNNEFAGVYSADNVVESSEILNNLKSVSHNLAYVIANTDASDKSGTHWWTIFNIVPANAIYFLDSFSEIGFDRFILQDDMKVLQGTFTSLHQSTVGGINF